ncbi:MAG: hypothetical protein QM702_04320 [Rubrivivax sp.]
MRSDASPNPRSAAPPEGWRLVPVEATEEMVNAAAAAARAYMAKCGGNNPRATWAAMLAAAPDAPLPQPESEQDHECRFACWWPRNRVLLAGMKQAARAAWHAAIASSRAEPAQAPPVTPEGCALVPKRMTQAMRDVTDAEGWTWEDLLAAAGAINEDEHAALAGDEQPEHLQVAAAAVLQQLAEAFPREGIDLDAVRALAQHFSSEKGGA